MVSPLSRITVPVVTDLQPRTPTEAIISNIAASQAENRAGSPLARAKSQLATPFTVARITSICDEDGENLGGDIARQTGMTTEKIIRTMGVSSFDEIGATLVAVQAEADALDPATLMKGGIMGWVQRRFGNVKQQLTLRLKSAEDVFDSLGKKIADHITVQSGWVRDLDSLYTENFERYRKVREVIEQAREWERQMVTALEHWPEISIDDPDAAMKAQERRDAEARLNRLRIKIDSFVRLQALTENHAPRIRSQQETARTTIQTLRDVVDQTIPVIKSEFALYIQSLDSRKSVALVTSTRGLATKTLEKSSEAAKNAAIESAQALNAPSITNETLTLLRTRMLDTLTEVRRIETDAQQRRVADEAAILDGQKQYLAELQHRGAV